jgi:Flp pilus assembly pilin Flp
MMKFLNAFRNDEDGAVTVDWVVLTAAVVGLAIAALTAVDTGLGSATNDIQTELQGSPNLSDGAADG